MLRSFLLPRLRRHDCRRSVAQLGRRGACWTNSRGYTSSLEEHMDTHDADNPSHKKRHLYLVLDDWKKGFSIHKLNLDDRSDCVDLTLRAPIHRQVAHCSYWHFASVGRNIVATGRLKSEDDNYVTLMYDTETAGLSIVPPHPAALHGHGHRWHLATAAGGLYTFEANQDVKGAMYRLEDMPAPASKVFWWKTRDHWSWSSIPMPPPFRVFGLESSAVHPEGGERTLFVSVGDWDRIPDIEDDIEENIGDDREEPFIDGVVTDDGYLHRSQTFSYDMETNEWRRHGDWDLPFSGQAYYDDELDAWVGLRKIYETEPCNMKDGYLCSCEPASPNGSDVQPAWKLCSERLFDPRAVCHISATLVYMGDSNYCLVELMAHEGFKSRRCASIGNKCVIRVATFRLKYVKNGEIIIKARGPDRSDLFSTFVKNPKVHAFWM